MPEGTDFSSQKKEGALADKVSSSRQAIEFLAARIKEAYSRRSEGSGVLIFALDGRAASGKSTLAAALKNRLEQAEKPSGALSVHLIHLDDYFLRPEQRTSDRLSQAGENVDSERIVKEILKPARMGEPLLSRPWSCARQTFEPPEVLDVPDIVLLEGSYSHNQDLNDFVDLSCFLTCRPETQRRRILQRSSAEVLAAFESRWIPLEEFYIETLHPDQKSSWVMQTDDWF